MSFTEYVAQVHYIILHYIIHSKQYRLFRENPSVLLSCNPRRIILGLHGNSTEVFFLKNLYCLVTVDVAQLNCGIPTGHYCILGPSCPAYNEQWTSLFNMPCSLRGQQCILNRLQWTIQLRRKVVCQFAQNPRDQLL